jgi:hypothetical protein
MELTIIDPTLLLAYRLNDRGCVSVRDKGITRPQRPNGLWSCPVDTNASSPPNAVVMNAWNDASVHIFKLFYWTRKRDSLII